MVPFEVIIFLHPEFGDIVDFSVQVNRVSVELVLGTEVRVLYFSKVLGLGDLLVNDALWLIGLNGLVTLREEDHWRVVALVYYPQQHFLVISV